MLQRYNVVSGINAVEPDLIGSETYAILTLMFCSSSKSRTISEPSHLEWTKIWPGDTTGQDETADEDEEEPGEENDEVEADKVGKQWDDVRRDDEVGFFLRRFTSEGLRKSSSSIAWEIRNTIKKNTSIKLIVLVVCFQSIQLQHDKRKEKEHRKNKNKSHL